MPPWPMAGTGLSTRALFAWATTTPEISPRTTIRPRPPSASRPPPPSRFKAGKDRTTRISSTSGAITRGTRAQPFSPTSHSAQITVPMKMRI
ncbi:hypothetical protein D3C72_735920 [compost metagenome]